MAERRMTQGEILIAAGAALAVLGLVLLVERENDFGVKKKKIKEKLYDRYGFQAGGMICLRKLRSKQKRPVVCPECGTPVKVSSDAGQEQGQQPSGSRSRDSSLTSSRSRDSSLTEQPEQGQQPYQQPEQGQQPYRAVYQQPGYSEQQPLPAAGRRQRFLSRNIGSRSLGAGRSNGERSRK